MPTAYHRIAGSSLERLAALSDGIFAVVMTLVVLDLHVPVREGLHSEAALWHELARLAPQTLTYVLSFLTLGIFWVGQQTQLNQLARSNRDLTWIHLGFLLGVSLMPFSTGLLAEFITFRLALVAYWLNLLLLGALLFVSRRYAVRAGLLRDDVTAEMLAAGERRIVVYQALYAVCVLVGLVSTYAGIALLVLLQFNSAIAPRIRPLDRF
jgi:TMEM175 potassium channel family protein